MIDLGLDSLMVTEVRQLIERDYNMTFTADEVQRVFPTVNYRDNFILTNSFYLFV